MSAEHGGAAGAAGVEPGGALGKIVARTRRDLDERKALRPLRSLEAEVEPAGGRSLAGALLRQASERRARGLPALGLIAEFKPSSPSRGPLRPGADPVSYARAYGERAAAASVLTDAPFFGGGHHLLGLFRRACELPLLCKDFVLEAYQVIEARAHGADAVLLMASLHGEDSLRSLLSLSRGLGMEALVEAHDEAEIEAALAAGASVVGVNARDLRTLRVDAARALPLLGRLPPGVVRVAESGVSTPGQVAALDGLADAVLVGTALMEAPTPEQGLGGLGW